MNKLFFIFKLKNNKKRIILITLLLSLVISASIYYNEAYTLSFREKVSSLVNSDYDVKVTALINKTLLDEISNESYVDDAAFVLITDLWLNNERVVGALISEISKLNMTNYNPLHIKERINNNGILISEDLANRLGLKIGDTVVIRPIFSNQSITLPVSGVVKFPSNIHVDVALEYPEEFKEYYASRLPMNALFGEVYVKIKDNKSDEYLSKVRSLTVDSYYRSEKIKDLKLHVSKLKSNPFFIISKFSGIFAAMVVVAAESNLFTSNIRKIKIELNYVYIQFVLYMLPSIVASVIAGFITAKLIFGSISSESMEILALYLPLAAITAYVSVYIATKRG